MSLIVYETELRQSPGMTHQQIAGRGRRDVSLDEAINSALTAKKMCNCRPRYIESLRAYWQQFARGREAIKLSEINVMTVEEWFAERRESLSTMASNMGRLAALFGFAVRREWMDRNPCHQLERVRIDRKPPTILTLAQCQLLMAKVKSEKPNEIAYFALALFAGVRPEEIEKITWSSVNLRTGFVTIDAAASKVRRRRLIELEPNALAWLELANLSDSRLPVGRMSRRRYLDYAEDWLGFKTWPQDSLRHTAASYLLAKHKNAPLVAERLGNSPSVLHRHYKELVTPEDCAAFWSITP